jgi:hypothetical protein
VHVTEIYGLGSQGLGRKYQEKKETQSTGPGDWALKVLHARLQEAGSGKTPGRPR